MTSNSAKFGSCFRCFGRCYNCYSAQQSQSQSQSHNRWQNLHRCETWNPGASRCHLGRLRCLGNLKKTRQVRLSHSIFLADTVLHDYMHDSSTIIVIQKSCMSIICPCKCRKAKVIAQRNTSCISRTIQNGCVENNKYFVCKSWRFFINSFHLLPFAQCSFSIINVCSLHFKLHRLAAITTHSASSQHNLHVSKVDVHRLTHWFSYYIIFTKTSFSGNLWWPCFFNFGYFNFSCWTNFTRAIARSLPADWARLCPI